ncbi:MAG: 2-oxoacid:acceptor oxidoreductase family protein [Armatimonadota bacterium]|nr:2-oxoacid:acceptor oxidoreductase family protein [Armatimonadota bacterium]
MRLAIRLTGAGGQGIVLAGLLLAEAAVRDGHHVVCTQAYGPESRGGASRSEVIVSDAAIAYPVARQVDLLIALTPDAWARWWPEITPGGIALPDADRANLPAAPAVRARAVPIVATARAVTGSPRPANVVAVGVAAALCALPSRQALDEAVRARWSTAAAAVNLRALDAGWRVGTALRAEGWAPRAVAPAGSVVAS